MSRRRNMHEEFANALAPLLGDRADEGARAILDALGPDPTDFLRGAVVEARYQQVRWDDANKGDHEWFWTLGYLASKVLHRDETPERRQHHLTAAAGLLANWHAHVAAHPDDERHSREEASDERP